MVNSGTWYTMAHSIILRLLTLHLDEIYVGSVYFKALSIPLSIIIVLKLEVFVEIYGHQTDFHNKNFRLWSSWTANSDKKYMEYTYK